MQTKFPKLLPILQSSLPPFERMLPYLEQIESNRCHSNFGKFFNLFEERMADLLGIPKEQLVIVCNGTLALVGGLLAMDIPRGKYCIVPSWTFSATPASALLAGLTPLFLDVELESQSLTPERVKEFLQHTEIPSEEIGAVIAVSPFGAPISRKSWDEFTRQTGIPAMIDAAASFDTVHRISSMQVGATPMMVSLHATKILGIGEGGMLLSTNTDLIKRVRGLSNFGFDVSRVSSYPGMNAKMSEYQAAIGLAVLDSWAEIRAKRYEVTSAYINMFSQLDLDSWLSLDWLSATANVLLPGYAAAARDHMLAANVESRIWWGNGCHSYPAYQHLPREKTLANTVILSNYMLGLPCSIDLTKSQITQIGECLAEFLSATDNTKINFAKQM